MPFKKPSEISIKNKEPKERKLFITNFDFAVQDLVNKMKDEDIVIPKLQRDYVWNSGGDETKPSRLIESLVLNMPIPNFYFAEDETLKYGVIDGQQRLETFRRFFHNEFVLENLEERSDLNGKKYGDLEPLDRDKIRKRAVRAVVVGNESDSNIKFDIFERLNTGSVVLSSQDVRHAIYDGNFNALLVELAPKILENFQFSKEIDKKTKSAEEMVLRFFAFYAQGEDNFGTDDNQLKGFLNKFMEANKDLTQSDVTHYKSLFNSTFDQITKFVENPFKKPNLKNNKKGWEGKSNRSIFDMLMLSFAWEKTIQIDKQKFNEIYRSLFTEDEKIKRNLGYTNKTSLRYNVSKIRQILRNDFKQS